ncbi:MAG: zf-HC2 domain-containing protein [Candidatus Hydrothermales bacterium]
MFCKEFIEKISLYIDGYLNEKEKISVENHMKICKGCKKIYEDILTIKILSPSLLEKFPIKKEKTKLKYLRAAFALSLIIIIVLGIFFQNKLFEKNTFKRETVTKREFDPVKIYYTDMIYEISYEEVMP